MKSLLLCLSLVLTTLPDARSADGQAEATWREAESKAIVETLRDLQRERATVLALAPDNPARVRHLAGLQELLRRAYTVPARDLDILVYTELHRFGVTIPKAIRLCINDDQTVSPQVLVHPETHVLYVLESDGRHITAITPEGKILWHRNPFEDAGLLPYRFTKPVIRIFAFMKDDPQKIGINFNSSQGGILDVTTGDFLWQGQD